MLGGNLGEILQEPILEEISGESLVKLHSTLQEKKTVEIIEEHRGISRHA